MNIEQALPWIIGLPLAGAIMNGLAGRFANRRLVAFVAVGSVLGSFGIACNAFYDLMVMKADGTGEVISTTLWEWFSIHIPGLTGFREIPVNISLVFDSLSGLMVLVITGIGSLIHIYSLGYMSEEKSYARFFTYLNLFTASMLILVLGSSFPVLFVGWEGVGLCSYLLIGFWYENTAYAEAGKKAFIANRIGDFGVIIGMFILVGAAGSFEFSAINAAAPGMATPLNFGGLAIGSIATVGGLFLFLGCTGKSAQIPLFVWLPDAMAGPTPVSALIHAATMVTAGVYLCCRLSPVFMQSAVLLSTIAIIGACTAFLAATVAVVQNEMKKILAYSTVSQLGFMFAAVGVGAMTAGFFHVFTHAFFKACLFLGAGSVMHAVHAHGDADIRKLGGLKKWMPITRWTFLLACLAIAGVPPFSGFFSKDEILLGAAEVAMHETMIPSAVGWFVFVVLFLAATMTAFYMFRLYFLTFTGDYRSAKKKAAASDEEDEEDEEHDEEEAHDEHDDHGYSPHPHESEWPMALPLVVLGAGSVVVGFLGLPHLLGEEWVWWGHWLEPSITNLQMAGEDHIPAYVAMAAGTIAMLIGVVGAAVAYRDKNEDKTTGKIPKPIREFFFDKWRVDELYEATILRGSRALGVLAGWLDKTFVDTMLTGATAKGVQLLGWASTRIQVGRVHAYGLAIAIGLGVMSWYVLYPHAEVAFEVDDQNATYVATRGLGYEYRWDVDSDGTYDVPAQPVRVRIDIKDDASPQELFQVVNVVRAALASDGLRPADRTALGHPVGLRSEKVYELAPPPALLENLLAGLERLEILDGVEVLPDPHGEVFDETVTVQHAYDEDSYVGYALLIGQLRGEPRELRATESGTQFDVADLGQRWRASEEDATPPAFKQVEGGVEIRPNGAMVRVGNEVRSEPFVLGPGESANVGSSPVRVVPVARVTVQVRNAFGNVDTHSEEVTLMNSGGRVRVAQNAGGAR
ncbi:MAG: NADH-quinone oxidoreductase subunit L [Deltaproteobacteria bacterium]|nr:NADH-quinone oxidoreductase subunit L [Deltaproteobacteria bacterium]